MRERGTKLFLATPAPERLDDVASLSHRVPAGEAGAWLSDLARRLKQGADDPWVRALGSTGKVAVIGPIEIVGQQHSERLVTDEGMRATVSSTKPLMLSPSSPASSANAWIVGTCIVVATLRVPIVSGPRAAELIKVGLGAWLLALPFALGFAVSERPVGGHSEAMREAEKDARESRKEWEKDQREAVKARHKRN